MAENEDAMSFLAAEYVLGTLDFMERRRAERRLENDPEFAREVEAWSERFEELLDGIAPIDPPAHVWDAISGRVEREMPRAAAAKTESRQKAVNLWRAWAIAATVVLCTSLFLWYSAEHRAAQTGADARQYVAVLDGDEGQPAMVITVDTADATLTIAPIRDVEVVGQDLELWLLPLDGSPPRSLGLANAGNDVRLPVTVLNETPAEQMTFAISLEPQGGSPTGQPTGPILFTGKLLSLPD